MTVGLLAQCSFSQSAEPQPILACERMKHVIGIKFWISLYLQKSFSGWTLSIVSLCCIWLTICQKVFANHCILFFCFFFTFYKEAQLFCNRGCILNNLHSVVLNAFTVNLAWIARCCLISSHLTWCRWQGLNISHVSGISPPVPLPCILADASDPHHVVTDYLAAMPHRHTSKAECKKLSDTLSVCCPNCPRALGEYWTVVCLSVQITPSLCM